MRVSSCHATGIYAGCVLMVRKSGRPDLRRPREGKREGMRLLARGRGLAGLLLLAVGAEFLAFLAVQALGIRLLRAFERGGATGLCGLCGLGSGRRTGGGSWRLRVGSARKEERSGERKAGRTGGDRDHGGTSGKKRDKEGNLAPR